MKLSIRSVSESTEGRIDLSNPSNGIRFSLASRVDVSCLLPNSLMAMTAPLDYN
jgi:hypothetical protein